MEQGAGSHEIRRVVPPRKKGKKKELKQPRRLVYVTREWPKQKMLAGREERERKSIQDLQGEEGSMGVGHEASLVSKEKHFTTRRTEALNERGIPPPTCRKRSQIPL